MAPDCGRNECRQVAKHRRIVMVGHEPRIELRPGERLGETVGRPMIGHRRITRRIARRNDFTLPLLPQCELHVRDAILHLIEILPDPGHRRLTALFGVVRVSDANMNGRGVNGITVGGQYVGCGGGIAFNVGIGGVVTEFPRQYRGRTEQRV